MPLSSLLVCIVARRKHKIDVLVHYRDLRPLAKDQARVTLLQRGLPATIAQWGYRRNV